jgi:hypothetical protein
LVKYLNGLPKQSNDYISSLCTVVTNYQIMHLMSYM